MHRYRNYFAVGCYCLIIATTDLQTASASIASGAVWGNGDISSNVSGGGFTFNANDRWAVPFTTGPSTPADQLWVSGAYVLVGDNSTAVNFSVGIYATTAGAPDPTPLTSGSVSGFNPGTNNFSWEYVTFAPVTLTQSTTYYIAVSEPTAATGFQWSRPTPNQLYSDLGSGSGYTSSGNLYSDTPWFSQPLSVTSTGNTFAVQLVPEPGTYALLASGLCAAAVAASRRRSRSSAQRQPAPGTASLSGDMAAALSSHTSI